jgi:hypothetical protein
LQASQRRIPFRYSDRISITSYPTLPRTSHQFSHRKIDPLLNQWCVSLSRRLQPPIAEQIVSQLVLPFEILSTPPGAVLRHIPCLTPDRSNDDNYHLANVPAANHDPFLLHLPPTSRLRSRHRPCIRLGLRHALAFALALALNKHPQQQQQSNHDPVHEPSVIPQPVGLAPRRRGGVHVRDVPAVQDDRARV